MTVIAIVAMIWGDELFSAAPRGGPSGAERSGLSTAASPASSDVSARSTTAPMANPFSTFQQLPRGEGGAATPTAPPAPALPFAYAGTRIEGGRTVVVLAQQGRTVAVQGPGMLDAVYEVESIDERQIVLVYLPLMTRQVLALPPARAQAAQAVPAVESTESDSEPEN